MKSGVLIVDKPQDFTSFDVLASLRRPMGTKKLGHTGTLDPMATGVLPVLVQSATRAADLLPDHDKAYRASLQFGITTDTQDITGMVLSTRPVHISWEMIEQACIPLRGAGVQIPPMYSAVKKDGVRLYDLARKGITVERQARPIFIQALTLEAFDEQTGQATVFVRCSKGTYIRTLIADLGEALGCGATMTSLRRTEACGFTEPNAVPLDRLRALTPDEIDQLIQPTELLFSTYPKLAVTAAQSTRFANGGELSADRIPLPMKTADGQLLRVVSPQGTFLGLGVFCEKTQAVAVRKLFVTNELMQTNR